MSKRFWRRVLKEFEENAYSDFLCIGSTTFDKKWGGKDRAFCAESQKKHFTSK